MAKKTIDSLCFGSDTHIFTLPYGTCSTPAATVAKTVAVQGGNFSLETGSRVLVKFTVTNTANNPTLNVSSTGAKAIFYEGSAIPSSSLVANQIYEFVYTGTNWELIGDTKYTHPSSHAASMITGLAPVATSGSYNDLTNKVPNASGTVAGITKVYPAASCTSYTSDEGTCTPLAVQNSAKKFAITRPSSTTEHAITRYTNTTGDVENSKIIIEDVTNTKDTTKTANVIAIPAEGNKKMVYGYCTDQVDGTSFIGGVFPSNATEYPYAEGLAIGGTSGNLLWKGKVVATQENVNNAIGALDKADTAVAGKYVTEVDQTDGIISVSRDYFPTFHRTSGTATGTKTTNATNSPAVNARSTTSGRYYGVEADAKGAMYVNVPWTDNNTDTKVKQSPSTTDGEFPILLRSTSAGTTETTTTASFNATTTINPSSGRINIKTSEPTIHGSYGAVDVNLIEGDYDATYTSHGILYSDGSSGANMFYSSLEKCITFEFY